MDEDDDQTLRYTKLGFKPQKEIVYNKLLPYSQKLDDESLRLYKDIKLNLVKSIQLREIRPGCIIWTSRLVKYLKVYGFKFSKEDHIALIKLLYELLTIPDLEPIRVHKFATTLTHLLKKKELIAPSELQLQWRPLYDLYKRTIASNQTSVGMYRYFSSLETTLHSLVNAARIYFPASATEEMLAEWRPKLCPFDASTIGDSIELLEWFLPVSLPPAEAHLSYRLWFDELMDLWHVCHNAPPWESDMMWLFARLSSYNIGYIDWEPFVPLMFTRFLRSMNLPVAYHQEQSSKRHKLDTTSIAFWIVTSIGNGNSVLKYLEKFMQTLESYYYPANTGRWMVKLRKLFRELSYNFVERLHYERFKKLTWQTPVPELQRLTEHDIDTFVNIMKPIAMQSIYSRQDTMDIHQGLQYLATLRPDVIVPLILDKIYSTLDSLTEPHRLTASLHCLVAVARPMVQGFRNGYRDGPTHVIPLLFSLLPGIDPNDSLKCFVTFQFMATFISMVPLVDSSGASDFWTDLSDEEHAVCEASAGLEDFILQFFDRVFTLIESSALETTRMEQSDMERRSRLETIAENTLFSICNVIATQTSQSIFKSALKKLHVFVMEHILETRVSGKMLATICRSFVKVNPVETLAQLLPHLCERVNQLLGSGDEIQKEENLDTELLYNLLLLSEMLVCNGTPLLPYVDDLMLVLDRTLHLTCRRGHSMASRLLDHLMTSLTLVHPMETRSIVQFHRPVQEYLSIRDWGQAGNVGDLSLEWYVPGDAEIACVQKLLNRYLPTELECLNAYVDGGKLLTREELRCSLNIVWAVLGSQTVLPMWQEPAIQLVHSKLKPWAFELVIGTKQTVTMPNGENVRQVVIDLMHRLQRKILQCAEDDTKSLYILISIWDTLLMNKISGRNLEVNIKHLRMLKKLSEDRLHGNKCHLRNLLISRVTLQQELRMEMRSCTFTETHRRIIADLYTLSTSHYSGVRVKAQRKLFSVISTFPYAYTVLTPYLKESLQLDSNENHEQFKGCLYMLLGPKGSPIVTRHDWTFVQDIWPLLVRSKPSEKPSVINLINSIVDAVHRHFPTISIQMQIPQVCLNAAQNFAMNIPKLDDDGPLIVTEQERSDGEEYLKELSRRNEQIYNTLLEQLLQIIQSGNLHWRHHRMALSFIRDLVHPNVYYSPQIVQYVLQTLVHESLELRKIAIRVTLFILKQLKPRQNKITIDPRKFSKQNVPMHEEERPGHRPDNEWIQYNSGTRPLNESDWKETRFLHQPYHGYYTWPKTVEMYAPEQIPVENNEQTEHVHTFFGNARNIDLLIKYLSLEEKKGKDNFNSTIFMMFKNLFRNTTDTYLQLFVPHLERLVASKEEHDQRCAAEIIAGFINGSKHWSLEKVTNLWSILTPIIRAALSNMTVETIPDWGMCFAAASENRDPNRYHWLYELLMEDPLRDEASFIECGRLYALQCVLNQQKWRLVELYQRLFAYLSDYLRHPFQNVRERIGSVLTIMFEVDLQFPGGSATKAPRIAAFISDVMPTLNILYKTGSVKSIDSSSGSDSNNHTIELIQNTDGEKDVTIMLFKTVCKWVIGSIIRANFGAVSEFYQLYPLACLLQSYEADEELCSICSSLIAILAQSLTLPIHVPAVLNAIQTVSVSRSWSARNVNTEFIQVFVFHNMAIIFSNDSWVQRIIDIVLTLLEDEQLEVRVKAGQVLGGLLHCQLVPDADGLLEGFKKKSSLKTKLHHHHGNRKMDSIRLRHAAVLGLCAFIDAHPYDVPAFLPDVFLHLGLHLNDPQPIPTTIRKCLGNFKRTHHDNWQVHKLKFTEEELAIFSDLTIPPTYYA